MSQRRDELLQIRQNHFALVERLRKTGDYDASAPAIRAIAENFLQFIEHMLERTK
jgi:hypothetical protein